MEAGIIVLLIIGFNVYLVPTWVAYGRGHHNRGAILAMNILLGWTFLGWVAALVWSLMRVDAPKKAAEPVGY